MPTVIILFVSLLEVRQNFVSEVVMAFIIYLPTLPYNILFTERRGLSSRLSRNLSILCRPTSSLKRCSTIHFLIWHMRYLGVHSVILHDHYLFIYLCFSNRSYHIRQFSMTAYNSITVVTF